jgi:hypothetical protein
LHTELAGVLKLNQVGLDKAEQLHTSKRKKTAFLFAEMGLAQSEQHLLWPPVCNLFIVCLALVD